MGRKGGRLIPAEEGGRQGRLRVMDAGRVGAGGSVALKEPLPLDPGGSELGAWVNKRSLQKKLL